MSAEDFALLAGISIYPNPGFSSLDGPPNDIQLFKKWLMDPAGGDVLESNIVIVRSPSPYPKVIQPDTAPPISEEFDLQFRQLLNTRMALQQNRVRGRLYLFFAGHGFCHRTMDRDSEAALYSANATKSFFDHIFGTQYARVAKGKALFEEIVLIMDCCRDSEINRAPTRRPYTDTPDDGLAANARLLAIYAVPKGGKAHERTIEERNGAVHGLLTHALVKALEEARPTRANSIAATALRDLVWQSWDKVCGPDPPPRPEIFLPGNGEIFLGARNLGSAITFSFDQRHPPRTTFVLRDGSLNKVAVFSATGHAADDLAPASGPLIGWTRNLTDITLRLQPGLYCYELSTGGGDKFEVPGANSHVSL